MHSGLHLCRWRTGQIVFSPGVYEMVYDMERTHPIDPINWIPTFPELVTWPAFPQHSLAFGALPLFRVGTYPLRHY